MVEGLEGGPALAEQKPGQAERIRRDAKRQHLPPPFGAAYPGSSLPYSPTNYQLKFLPRPAADFLPPQSRPTGTEQEGTDENAPGTKRK